MDYEKYIKKKYMKMIMKNIRIPFSDEWEKGLVAEQFLFLLTNQMSESALKLLNAVPETFNQDFSDGKEMIYNKDNIFNINYFLRAQNFLNKLIKYIENNSGIIDNIIAPGKENIDIAIWKYYIGNKTVLKSLLDLANEQVIAINNSLASSFKDNQKELADQKNELIQTFNKTNEDINRITDKMNKYLFSSEVLNRLSD